MRACGRVREEQQRTKCQQKKSYSVLEGGKQDQPQHEEDEDLEALWTQRVNSQSNERVLALPRRSHTRRKSEQSHPQRPVEEEEAAEVDAGSAR